MTHQEILTKAIEKAVRAGYKNPMGELSVDDKGSVFVWLKGFGDEETTRVYGSELALRNLIYDHRFARAIWNETPEICSQCQRYHETNADCDCGGWPISAIKHWQYHLQQMVIADDPIEYLASTLE